LRTCCSVLASIVVSLPARHADREFTNDSAAIYPLLVLTQSVPKVALAPILLVALGANEFSRVIITSSSRLSLVVSSVAGLLATPPELIELGARVGRVAPKSCFASDSLTRCRLCSADCGRSRAMAWWERLVANSSVRIPALVT